MLQPHCSRLLQSHCPLLLSLPVLLRCLRISLLPEPHAVMEHIMTATMHIATAFLHFLICITLLDIKFLF